MGDPVELLSAAPVVLSVEGDSVPDAGMVVGEKSCPELGILDGAMEGLKLGPSRLFESLYVPPVGLFGCCAGGSEVGLSSSPGGNSKEVDGVSVEGDCDRVGI